MVRPKGIKVKLPKRMQTSPGHIQRKSSNYSKPKLANRESGGGREREQSAVNSNLSENSILPCNLDNFSTPVLNTGDSQVLVCPESMSEIEGSINELAHGSPRVNSTSSSISRPSHNSTNDSHFILSMVDSNITHIPGTPSSNCGDSTSSSSRNSSSCPIINHSISKNKRSIKKVLRKNTRRTKEFLESDRAKKKKGKNEHICKTCNKKFAVRCYLNRHEKTHLVIRNHQCKTCNKKFTSRPALKRHEQIHLGIKNHQCKICNKKFTSRQSLKQHEKIHSGIKDHKCTLCEYASVHKSSLDLHIRQKHTNERPYKCQVEHCGYSSVISGNLKCHQLVHKKDDESVQKFTCAFPSCSYKSAYKSSLIRHQKTVHSNIRDFKCPFSRCEYDTTWKNDLTKHIKRMHKNKSPPPASVSLEVIQEEDDETAPVINIVILNQQDGADENQIQEEEVETTLTEQNEQSNFSILRIYLNSKGSLVYAVQENSSSSSFDYLSSTEAREKFPALVIKFFESNPHYWKCPKRCRNEEHESHQ